MRNSFCLTIIFAIISTISTAQNQKSSLKLEEIMKGEQFIGFSPDNIRWSDDSKKIYFSWNPDNNILRDNFYVDISEKDKKPKNTDSSFNSFPAIDADYNNDRSKKIFSRNGDLFLMNLNDFTEFRITKTQVWESNPKFLSDDSKIVYRSGLNLYIWDSNNGQTDQITDFRKGEENKEKNKSNIDIWLESENLELFSVLRERKELNKARKNRQELQKEKAPKTIWLADADLTYLELSPNKKFVYYSTIKRAKKKNTIYADYMDQSGFTSSLTAREKVGSAPDIYTAFIYNIEMDSIISISTENLPGVYNKPEFLKEYSNKDSTYSDKYQEPKKVIWHGPFLYKGNSYAVYDIKSLDAKDRWLIVIDADNPEYKVLDWQHDEAWIGGPGISGWKGVPGNGGFMNKGEEYWFHSEESGFSHLYAVNLKTLKKRQLTSGNWEVLDAFLSNDGQNFYLNSSEVDPGERHFYKMSNTTLKREKITTLQGNNEVYISPDEKWLAIRYSYSNKPWELYLMENKANAEIVQLTDSRTETFKKYNWKDPELIYFKADDGAMVRARLYKPLKVKKGAAAIIFVHGAGYLQNAHKWWSSYYREYMFHNFLSDMGYTVLDVDYRASSGYGREWRTAIYRHMGGKDLSDQIDAAKYLVNNHKISPNRIGIYGGSYGGFITLMAMFKSPKTFKSGAALRSVTDWAHYNHPYTSNILNTPQEDPKAYRRSSPIYFAEGLMGKLLILHGILDDNVQFQDVVRLSQKLIELGKKDWEMALFPVEAHGFIESSSWTDEYRRILELFEETIGN